MNFKIVRRGLGENRKYFYKGFEGSLCGEGYDEACAFDGEYAKVKKYGEWYYVSQKEFAKTGSSHLYKYDKFQEDYNVVYENGKYYFIDEDGNMRGEGYVEAYAFSEGYAIVKKDGKYYFVDKDLNFKGEGYDDAYAFSEGYAQVKKDDKEFYVSKKEFERTGSSRFYKFKKFQEGFNIFYDNGKYYFIDKDLNFKGEGYDDAYDFSEGFAIVKKDNLWFFVDKAFTLLGEGYDSIYGCDKGYAKVEKAGKKFYVSQEEFAKTGSSHFYKYKGLQEGYNVVYENGKCYFIDREGKLYGKGYDDAGLFNQGLASVKKDYKNYLINENFDIVQKKSWFSYDHYRDLKASDYLNLAKKDAWFIASIPAEMFSDRFIEKLRKNVFKYCKKKIKETENLDDEKFKEQMTEIQITIQTKQKQYQQQENEAKEKIDKVDFKKDLLKQAKMLLVGDPRNVEITVLGKGLAENFQAQAENEQLKKSKDRTYKREGIVDKKELLVEAEEK